MEDDNKPIAYNGTEPYLFISYAHADSAVVLPLIKEMQMLGIRIWYDEGIELGSEFPQYIEDAIVNSAAFLQFVSPCTIESFFCRNEIGLSIDLKSNVTLVVYLEQTELKHGLRLQLRNIQALMYYKYLDKKLFFEKLIVNLQKIAPDVFEENQNVMNSSPQNYVCNTINDKTEVHIISKGRFDKTDLNQINAQIIRFGKEVTELPNNVFQSEDLLEQIYFESDSTHIGQYAFAQCSNLKYVVLPSNIEVIGPGTFEKCIRLNSIIMPPKLLKIGYRSFLGCRELEKIEFPSGLTTIDNSAFFECESICKIIIPETVSSIGEDAFSKCIDLKEVKMKADLAILRDRTFCGCSNLKVVQFQRGLKKIGNRAFEGCINLDSIELPPNVSSIGNYAFLGCLSLTAINLPSTLKEIGAGAFCDCLNLAECIIPDMVKKIKDGTFANCKKLEFVSLPQDCIIEGNPFPKQCKVTIRKNKPGIFSFITKR